MESSCQVVDSNFPPKDCFSINRAQSEHYNLN